MRVGRNSLYRRPKRMSDSNISPGVRYRNPVAMAHNLRSGIESPPPLTSPIPLPFFLLRPRKRAKKKAPLGAGPVFRELPQERKLELGGLRALPVLPTYGDLRNDTEKPPVPPGGREVNLQGRRACLRSYRFWLSASPTRVGRKNLNAMPFKNTSRAERVVPLSSDDRCSAEAGRAMSDVHAVRKFALCIWQAPPACAC